MPVLLALHTGLVGVAPSCNRRSGRVAGPWRSFARLLEWLCQVQRSKRGALLRIPMFRGRPLWVLKKKDVLVVDYFK